MAIPLNMLMHEHEKVLLDLLITVKKGWNIMNIR